MSFYVREITSKIYLQDCAGQRRSYRTWLSRLHDIASRSEVTSCGLLPDRKHHFVHSHPSSFSSASLLNVCSCFLLLCKHKPIRGCKSFTSWKIENVRVKEYNYMTECDIHFSNYLQFIELFSHTERFKHFFFLNHTENYTNTRENYLYLYAFLSITLLKQQHKLNIAIFIVETWQMYLL